MVVIIITVIIILVIVVLRLQLGVHVVDDFKFSTLVRRCRVCARIWKNLNVDRRLQVFAAGFQRFDRATGQHRDLRNDTLTIKLVPVNRLETFQ